MKTITTLSTLLLAFLLAKPAQAAPLTVVNHSFEDITGESPFNEFTFGPLNGWDLYDPGGMRTPGLSNGDGPDYFIGTLTPFEPDPIGSPGVYANFPGGAPDGDRVGIAFNFYNADPIASTAGEGEYGMWQQTPNVLTANTAYRLRVEIGNIDSGIALNGTPFNLAGFPGYRVDLLAVDGLGNITVLASDDNSLDGLIPDGEWATSTVVYETGDSDAEIGQTIGIRLVNLNNIDASAPTADIEVDFDNVRLDATPIPEPSSLVFVLAASCAILLKRNRRKR